MNDKKARAIELWLKGLTYREIAQRVGVTTSTAVRYTRPPKAVYEEIKHAAGGKCQDCGVLLDRGRIHHCSPTVFAYLCNSCHSKRHWSFVESPPDAKSWERKGYARWPGGRKHPGNLNPHAIVTEADVLSLWENPPRGIPAKEQKAKELGLTFAGLRLLLEKRRWRHLLIKPDQDGPEWRKDRPRRFRRRKASS